MLSGVGAALSAALIVPLAGLAAGPATRDRLRWSLLGRSVPPTPRAGGWRSLGPISAFDVGVPRLVQVTRDVDIEGVREPTVLAAYVVRTAPEEALILDIHCTHMGCPVGWSTGARRYLCPCHGGAFNAEGVPVAGPPPRRLDRYQAIVEDQELWMGALVEPS